MLFVFTKDLISIADITEIICNRYPDSATANQVFDQVWIILNQETNPKIKAYKIIQGSPVYIPDIDLFTYGYSIDIKYAKHVFIHKADAIRIFEIESELKEYDPANYQRADREPKGAIVSPKEPDYLDPNHPRYAPKLAAAIRAWQAVTDPKGKSPKAALIDWLADHATEYGLSTEGIKEAGKVANWNPIGGAPTTPRK